MSVAPRMLVSIISFLCLFTTTIGKPGFGDGEQDWGYVEVREDAHMFWWLYYTTATENRSYYEKPLIIWLQGGPGESSTGFGNFMELGPLDINLKPRNLTWVKNYNVLFIDSPVGTGFSYVKNSLDYARNNTEIAVDLLRFIKKFYEIFPKFIDTPTYIATESYGGKIAVEFANILYKKQTKGEIKSNLKGIALGSPWISPIDSVMEYAPALLYMGMIDKSGYKRIQKGALKTKKAYENEKYMKADKLLDYTEKSIFNETSNMNIFNAVFKARAANDEYHSIYGDLIECSDRLAYFMNTKVKPHLNLDVFWGSTSAIVNRLLRRDYMKAAIDQVEILLNETDIHVYVFNGQYDIAVNVVGTEKWMNKLRWNNANNWKDAKRETVIINGVIEGYVKQYDRLKMFWVNSAGHRATSDNPVAVNAILKDLTSNS